MKRLTLILTLVCSVSLFAQKPAMNYLIQLGGGSGATWTKTLGANDSIVDLTVAGKTLTAWLAGRTSWTTGDQVWIAAGTYTFTLQYNIGSGPSLATSYPSAIYGGFAGTESVIADRAKGINPWNYTNETILDGSSSTNGIFNAGSDRTMTIDGLTFTNCTNTEGQAVYQRPNMLVQNCKFTNNACVALRYYISAASKTATTSHCYFYNNTNAVASGAEGGCIMANNASSGGIYTVASCVFDSNSCTASGSGASAGIKAQGVGTTKITNCIFKKNNATAGNSSAVSLTAATTNLINSVAYGTSLATNKTALYVSAGSVINCTVVNNLGGGAYLSNTTSSTINLINTVFWGTDAKSGQVTAASGCLGNITNCSYNSLSTNFSGTVTNSVDLTTTTTGLFTDSTNNNWSLAPGSVLIDMGTSTGAPTIDINGINRPQGAGYDIGAYEYSLTAVNSPSVDSKPSFIRSGNQLTALWGGKVTVFDVSGKILINKQIHVGDHIRMGQGVYIVTLLTATNKLIQKVAF